MNERVVHSKKKHNNKSQKKSLDRDLCEYYYLSLHRKINNSRYYVHYLAE